jgi:hypothetical protein
MVNYCYLHEQAIQNNLKTPKYPYFKQISKNRKAWKNCVSKSQCSPSTSFYMVHDHHSWVRLLTFKKPPPSQQNAWLHNKQIKVEFNNTCKVLLAITTFSTSKLIHFTKLQHTNQICIQTWKHKKKIHCKSSNNNNRSSKHVPSKLKQNTLHLYAN